MSLATRLRLKPSALFALSLLACGLVFYALIVVFFPGVYTGDSLEQLQQAKSGQYLDSHPPIMAGVWHLLIRVTGSETSLYWLHVCMLAAAVVTWLYVFFCSRLTASMLLVPALLISPALINFAGVIWKDVGFAFSMLLSAGLLALQPVHQRLRWPIALLVLVLTFYAVGVRWNGIAAAVPLSLLAVPGTARPRPPAVRRLLLALKVFAIIAGFGVCLHAVNYGVLRAERKYGFNGIQVFDLVGVLRWSGRDFLPSSLERNGPASAPAIASTYREESAGYLFLPGTDGLIHLRLPRDAAEREQVEHAWRLAVTSNSGAYLLHRAVVFKSLLRIGQVSGGWFPYVIGFADRPERTHLPFAANLARQTQAYLVGCLVTPVYLGWFWILLAGATTIGAFLLRSLPSAPRLQQLRKVSLAISLSVFLYVLPLFFAAPASDFRYLYWPVMATHFQVALLAGMLVQRIAWRQRHPAGQSSVSTSLELANRGCEEESTVRSQHVLPTRGMRRQTSRTAAGVDARAGSPIWVPPSSVR